MKKSFGTILMVVSAIFFCILMFGEAKLVKDGNLPATSKEWVTNLSLPLITICIFFFGKFLRKK